MGGNKASGIGASRRRAGGVDVPDVPDARDAAEEMQALDGPTHDDIGKKGVPHEWSFDLDYTDIRGHRWRVQFTTRILSIQERVQAGLAKARMAGGVSLSVLESETSLILEMQSHLAVSLTAWPDWAEELGKIRNVNVLGAIYQEVAAHEDRFWEAGPANTSDSSSS